MNDEVTLIVKVAATQQLADEVLGGGCVVEAEDVRDAIASTLVGQLDLRSGDFENVSVELA